MQSHESSYPRAFSFFGFSLYSEGLIVTTGGAGKTSGGFSSLRVSGKSSSSNCSLSAIERFLPLRLPVFHCTSACCPKISNQMFISFLLHLVCNWGAL